MASVEDGGRVQSLRSLCLGFICSSSGVLLNLDNVLDVLSFAALHHFEELERYAQNFVKQSYAGLRAKHPHAHLEASLGALFYRELEREQRAIEERLQFVKLKGEVIGESSCGPGPAVVEAGGERVRQQPRTTRRLHWT